jgi:hypothetical protein
MRTPFLFLIFISLCNYGSSQGLNFYKENITMKIDPGYFHVTGIYYLKSDRIANEILVYPYPVDSLYGAVDSICIYNMTTNKLVKPLKTDSYKTIFNIDFPQAGEQVIQISYRQKLTGNRAEYILKSTIGWKKTLDQANYQLIVPSAFQISNFSIVPQDSIVTSQEIIYLWNKNNYMPAENLIFSYLTR